MKVSSKSMPVYGTGGLFMLAIPLAKNQWSNGGNAYSCFYAQQAASIVSGPSVYKDEHVPEIQRAIFFTFSQENPVQQMELENFVLRSFSDGCIQKITMQQVLATEQPLWDSDAYKREESIGRKRVVLIHDKGRFFMVIQMRMHFEDQ